MDVASGRCSLLLAASLGAALAALLPHLLAALVPPLPQQPPLPLPRASPAPRAAATAAPTPFLRPTTDPGTQAHLDFHAAERARLGLGAVPNSCLMPPSHHPAREFSGPLTDAFGETLNLEAVKRPWAAGAPPEARYNPLSGVAELREPPTQVEFLRDYVHLGAPFVVRGWAQGHSGWGAAGQWGGGSGAGLARLREAAGDVRVRVRRSKHSDGFFHYAHNLSATREMSVGEFLDSLSNASSEQYYLGGQDILSRRAPGTLRALLPDVSPPPAFADGVLDLKHISLWLGRGAIANPAHYDSNENLLVMLAGQKTLTLLPPGARNFLLPTLKHEGQAPLTRMVDLEGASERHYPCLAHARALAATVTIREGDLLYIPPYYWHSVRSAGAPSAAVNLWYSVHSALLQQMMKSLDHSMLLHLDDSDRPPVTRQRVW